MVFKLRMKSRLFNSAPVGPCAVSWQQVDPQEGPLGKPAAAQWVQVRVGPTGPRCGRPLCFTSSGQASSGRALRTYFCGMDSNARTGAGLRGCRFISPRSTISSITIAGFSRSINSQGNSVVER